MKCPGQNTQFWRPDDVFEVSCGQCGYSVEFFKTDVSRFCPGCGIRIKNPRLNLGCAQWCSYAKECLGFDPGSTPLETESDSSLANRLVKAVRHEFGDDRKRINHTLLVFDMAQKILRKEGGDPRVVTAAALLHDIGIKEAERKHSSCGAHFQEVEGPPIARRIMEELGFDESTIKHVCKIVGNLHSGNKIDTPEFRIIWDADRIVNLLTTSHISSENKYGDSIKKVLKTNTGREMVNSLLMDNKS